MTKREGQEKSDFSKFSHNFITFASFFAFIYLQAKADNGRRKSH